VTRGERLLRLIFKNIASLAIEAIGSAIDPLQITRGVSATFF